VHSLLPPASEARIQYFWRLQESVFNGLLEPVLMFYFDEEWLTLSGYVSNQNNKHRSKEIPSINFEVPYMI
jgi:CRISPR/Cas system-associated endoribonuclease Cas2